MWIIRWTIIGAVTLIVAGFAMQNAGSVEVMLWTWKSQPVPLYLVAYAAFAVGIILAALIAAVNQVQHRMKLHRANKEISRLRTELDRLRTVTLDDELMADGGEE
ncbi:MAG: LapA family protein [Calditrichaeota bacterium]|nr:LapA family protein [Calditrichota bacterium]